MARHQHRPVTAAQRRAAAEVRNQLASELPDLVRTARRVRARQDELIDIFDQLRAERKRQRVSLATLAQRSGIDKARLSKLENATRPNVTIDTLSRYADALGLRVLVTLAQRAA